ncbi:MAG: SpoIIE family protein phosphatase [Planctomycetota bacterium]
MAHSMETLPEHQAPTHVRPVRPGWLEWDSSRVCIFDAETELDALHRAYFDEVGAGAANYLYLAGFRVAASWSSRLQGVGALSLMWASLDMLEQRGLGAFRVKEHDLESGRVTVAGSETMESWSWLRRHGKSKKSVCHYTRGLLAGLWCFSLGESVMSASDLVCWEVECAAAGAKECKFEIGSARVLRDHGFEDPAATAAVRWELLELHRRLISSSERLSTLENELAIRERAYQDLLDNMNDILLVLDHQKKVVFCNERFLEYTGLSLSEAIGSSPLGRILPDDRERVEQIYDAMLQGLVKESTYRFRVQRPTGVLVMESSARTIAGPKGEVAIELLGRDVTDQEKARQELEAAHALLLRKQQVADNDLRVAKLVHESLLPRPVSTPEIDLDFKYVPVERVGGDYCHFQFTTDHHCVVTLCDVSGHGMASALLAARVSSQVRMFCVNNSDPLAITTQLNEFLLSNFASTGLFVTFFALSIDLENLSVRYCGAGHPGPLLLRKQNGEVETLTSHNLPVGILADFLRAPAKGETKLEPGDRILLYTDGLTETMNAERGPLRPEGLEEYLREGKGISLFQLGEWILRQVDEFRTGARHDDMTLILLEAK